MGWCLIRKNLRVSLLRRQLPKQKPMSIEKVHRKSLAERLNRGWDDPEGVLVEEDYKVSGDARDEDGLLQVIEMDSSISYAKDIDAVSGYIDVRGAWHSY